MADPSAPLAPWLAASDKGATGGAPPAGSSAPLAPWVKDPQKKGFLEEAGINPGAIGQGIRQTAADLRMEDEAQYGANFDWNTGTDWITMRDFLAADNDKEKARVLDHGQKAGKWKGFGKKGDVWYVTDDKGVPRSILGTGPPESVFGGITNPSVTTAGIAAHPLQSLGMMATLLFPEFRAAGAAETGAEVTFKYVVNRLGEGTAYNLARSAFVGAMGAAGAAADDATKAFRDLWDKSDEELKGMLATAAATGMASEFFPRVFGSTAKTLLNGYAALSTPEQRALTRDALRRGMVPRISQAVPASKLLPFEQSMAEYIFGFPAEKGNKAAINRQITAKFVEAGMTPEAAAKSVDRINASVRQRLDRSETTDLLQRSADRQIAAETDSLDRHHKALQTGLDTQLNEIDRAIGSPDPNVQKVVHDAIVDARTKFGHEGQAKYRARDAAMHAAGENPVVIDNDPIKEAAQAMLDDPTIIQRDQYGQAIFPQDRALEGTLERIKRLPSYSDMGTLAGVRSELFRQGIYRDLSPGVPQTMKQRLARVVDNAMEDPGFGGANSEALRLQREADAYWKEGIQKFKGITVKALAHDLAAGHALDPRVIASQVFNPKFSREASQIHALIDPETWQKVGAAQWDNLKEQAIDKRTGKLRPDRFLEVVREQGKLLDEAYGPERAGQIRKFAEQNAALNGKLDAASLTPDNFAWSMQRYQNHKEILDQRLKDGYVQMLMKRGSDQKDAIEYMLDSPERIRMAKQFWGEGTPQWQKIKEGSMEHLIASSIEPDKSLLSFVFTPGALSGMLRKLSGPELDTLFGKETATDLLDLARTIDFVTGKPIGKGTGTFAAALIVLNPMKHLSALVNFAVGGHLMAQPWFVRWLSDGLSTGAWRNIDKVGKAIKAAIYTAAPSATAGVNREQAGEAADFVGSAIGSAAKDQFERGVNMMKPGGLMAPSEAQ